MLCIQQPNPNATNIVIIKIATKKQFVLLNNPVVYNTIKFQTSGLTKGMYQIQIIGTGGNILQQQQLMLDENSIPKQMNINSFLSKGIYCVRLVGNGVVETEKVIIQ